MGSKTLALALDRADTRLTARWITKAMTIVAVSILILSATTATSTIVSAWQADVPLNPALVLALGESTNPRSFDPSLRLTPDLAERWEVSPDGMVYTFYLRRNARFHDGRRVTAQDVLYS